MFSSSISSVFPILLFVICLYGPLSVVSISRYLYKPDTVILSLSFPKSCSWLKTRSWSSVRGLISQAANEAPSSFCLFPLPFLSDSMRTIDDESGFQTLKGWGCRSNWPHIWLENVNEVNFWCQFVSPASLHAWVQSPGGLIYTHFFFGHWLF